MEDSLYYCVTISPDGMFLPSSSYDLSGDLSSVILEERLNQAAMLTVKVPDPFKVMGHAIREGMYIQYDLGTEADHAVKFCGIIYTVEQRFPNGGVPELTLKAYDGMKELGMHTHSKLVPEEVALKEIVTKVAEGKDLPAPYKWKVKVDLSGEFMVKEAQMNQTDLMFLGALCDEYDCMMYVVPEPGKSGQFLFTEAAKLMKEEPLATLSYGRIGVPNPMIEFEATVDADGAHVPAVLSLMDYLKGEPVYPITRKPETPLRSEDPFWSENLAAIEDPIKRQKLDMLAAAGEAAAETVKALRLAGGDVEAAEPTNPFGSVSEMQFKADNWYSINANGMEGRGRTSGTPKLRAHMPVQIDDVGGRFSGKWFLTEVRHILGRDGYHTEFSCRR